MNVGAYLERIGHRGPVRTELETLTALHRAHLAAIPYENLDIHLGRTLALSEEAAFDKLVTRRRGGWCYEMNALFTAVLREIGFKIYRVAGAVRRAEMGDGVIGNHLIAIVDLGRPYLVDVGFGDGPLDPVPLEPGRYRHGAFEIGLERISEGWWRFHNHERGSAMSFDFTDEPRELSWFQEKCTELQTSPQSRFTQLSVVQRRLADKILVLRDATFTELTEGKTKTRTIALAEDFERVLREQFLLGLGADARRLWPGVEERHRKWIAVQSVGR